MADYYNAEAILSSALLDTIREHLPDSQGRGVTVYFSAPFYPKRNQQIRLRFLELDIKPSTTRTEIYEELAEENRLSVRQICKIVKPVRKQAGEASPAPRRYSGIRVTRREGNAKMHIRPEGAYV